MAIVGEMRIQPLLMPLPSPVLLRREPIARGQDNGRVLAMLAALRVALVQRKRVPLSFSCDRFPEAAHERTPTA